MDSTVNCEYVGVEMICFGASSVSLKVVLGMDLAVSSRDSSAATIEQVAIDLIA